MSSMRFPVDAIPGMTMEIPMQFMPEDQVLRRVRQANYLAALAAMKFGPESLILEERNVEADMWLAELVNLRQVQRRNR